tara:strand:- start:404 stop:1057 length:654 start_codon:yes stop_codon:yes gene_type:complete
MREDIKFDFDRQNRIGIIEAVLGENKNVDQLKKICKKVIDKNELVFITRINFDKAKSILDIYKNAEFYEEANCVVIGKKLKNLSTSKRVAIVAGGTSDLSVSLEAKLALEVHGVKCKTFIDVGVAGLHRLFSNLEEINRYEVIIVCAGMEGALPTVLGGLLAQPIIAVPVSVGYGVSKDGISALHCMLSSCAPGISVMNIDNGYGAAMAALRIIKIF